MIARFETNSKPVKSSARQHTGCQQKAIPAFTPIAQGGLLCAVARQGLRCRPALEI